MKVLDAIGLGDLKNDSGSLHDALVNNFVSPPSKEAVRKMLEAETDYSMEEDKTASERPAEKADPLDAFLPVKKGPNTPKRNLVKYTFDESNENADE